MTTPSSILSTMASSDENRFGTGALKHSAQITEEVRFAVVMYGGSSLAIYINGVVQELFHLVRATATKTDNSNELHRPSVSGTEAIYRRLGQLRDADASVWAAGGGISASAPVRTRFLVDILSGTSAGGINAVFLAKALANDQEFSVLKNLWVDGGAIEDLLNDRKSLKIQGKTLPAVNPPQSLLNSRRMYLLLYNALKKMEQGAPRDARYRSPYLEDLDLFITRTDIFGKRIPISLSNGTPTSDYQYRDVLHFRYADWLNADRQKEKAEYDTTDKSAAASQEISALLAGVVGEEERQGNDFLGKNDPFLAYAARCTSAFPVAFEPMLLKDIYSLTDYETNAAFEADVERWRRFFAQDAEEDNILSVDPASHVNGITQLAAGERREKIEERPFTDGGVLDNKPFSYAIDMLDTRWSDKTVERKLIYIEPSPEMISKTPQDFHRPDPMEIAQAALFDLPRYEAIHDDLRRVLHRNAILEKLTAVIAGMNEDIKSNSLHEIESNPRLDWSYGWRCSANRENKNYQWFKSYATIVQERGLAYGAYHRLKIQALTDALVRIVACQLGLKADSRYGTLLREMVENWRDTHYKIQSLMPGSSDKEAAFAPVNESESEAMFLAQFDLDYRLRRLLFVRGKINDHLSDKDIALERQEALYLAKKHFKSIFYDIRKGIYALTTRREKPTDTIKAQVEGVRAYLMSHVDGVAPQGTEEENPTHAVLHSNAVKALTVLLADIQTNIHKVTSGTTTAMKNKLECLKEPDLKTFERYVGQFEHYDSVLFPALYGTGIGETTHVDVIRVSPLDATTIVDESKGGLPKLAGTTLGNFGALLERHWRQNDIMWGRLDAAECLLKALIPQDKHSSPKFSEMLRQAQKAIIEEELVSQYRNDVLQRVFAGDESVPFSQRVRTELTRVVLENEGRDAKSSQPMSDAEMLLQPEPLIDYLKHSQLVRKATPKTSLTVLSRATAIAGKILQGAAERREMNAKPIALLPRFGQIFVSLVEVAMPGSLWNLFVRGWLPVLYVFECLLIFVGWQWGNKFPGMAALGGNMLFITLGVHLLITWLHSLMKSKEAYRRFRVLFIAVVIILLGFGCRAAYLGYPRLSEEISAQVAAVGAKIAAVFNRNRDAEVLNGK